MKGRIRAPLVLRFAGRVTAAAIALLIAVLVGVQFAHIVRQNVALADELSMTQHDIAALQVRRARQLRDIRRLQNPAGAVPEIHDRLRLVGPNETIVFVRPTPTPLPTTR